MAKEVTLRPSEPTLKKSLEEMNRALTETFTRILEAGRIKAKEFDKVQQTYEYIKQLIESANSMEQYAQELFHTAVTGTEDEFIKVAKLTGTQALDLVRKAEVAQQREPDLVKKQLIREGIAELREASKNMIEASKAVQKNKNDPNARLRLEEAQKRLAEAIRAIRRNVEGEYDESNQGRVAYKAEALESVANQLLRAARRKDVNQVQQDAQTFVSVGHQLVQDAQILLKDITNPAQKKALESDLQQLKLAINRFEQAAKRYAQNPDDPQALQELEDAHKNLFEKINSVKKSAKIIPGFDDKSFEEAAVSIQSMDTSSSKKIQVQLVSAAKEETNAALNLANEAEKNLSQFSGLQRKELEEGIEAIRSLAKEVKSDAEYLESHPHDVKAQERLANSQRRLGAAVEKVIKIHQNHSPSQDVANELNQMGSTTNPSTEVLQQAQQVLDQIGRTFGANANPDPETQMQNAKTLSAQATQLANKLKELAAASQDPIFKEKLLKSSKLLRDGAIQIKILSAVKAAGGEDKSNTVGSSANTLLHTITEAMNDIQSQQLKDRFRNTVKQTMAMNRVASLWKAKAK